MKQWFLTFLILSNFLSPRIALGAEECSRVFDESETTAVRPLTPADLRSELDQYFDEVSYRTIDKVLKDIDKKLIKKESVDLAVVSKTAQKYYEFLQDPIFKRYVTNLFYKKNAEQMVRSEEFATALMNVLRSSGALSEKQTLKLKYIQNNAPISWLTSISTHVAINTVLYSVGAPFMKMPLFFPKLSHPTFLEPSNRYQKAAVFAEKTFTSAFIVYLAVTIAWTLSDDDRREAALQPALIAYSIWQKLMSKEQESAADLLRDKLGTKQLTEDTEKLMEAADKLLSDLQENP